MHPAHEPIQLFKPLPAVGVGLVLIGGLHGLLQLVVTGTWIKAAKLRGAERDKLFTQPFRDEVESVDTGPADHPGPLSG